MNINQFAEKVYQDRLIAFAKRKYEHLDPDHECATQVVIGKKYDKVDVGPRSNWSGKFMIDKAGNIFGIKGYGQINKRKFYGTLETINEWFWGEYTPVRTALFDIEGQKKECQICRNYAHVARVRIAEETKFICKNCFPVEMQPV
jgi:hypothetical protein